MLAISTTAAQAIESILAAQGEAGAEAGIRITHQPTGGEVVNLAMDVAPAPEDDDQVVVEEGARVFLPPDTAMLLTDKVLEAQVDEQRVTGFTILEQR